MKIEVVGAAIWPGLWTSDEESRDAFLATLQAVETHHGVHHEVGVEWTIDSVIGTLQHCPRRVALQLRSCHACNGPCPCAPVTHKTGTRAVAMQEFVRENYEGFCQKTGARRDVLKSHYLGARVGGLMPILMYVEEFVPTQWNVVGQFGQVSTYEFTA